MTQGHAQSIDEHVRDKYSGPTCGAEEGVLSRFQQLRVELVKDMVREHVWKRDTGAKLLDIGCNDGTISAHLMDLGVRVYGIDLGEENVQRARAKGIEAQVANARERLPYGDGTFDVVFAGEILEHLYDPEAFMREVHRVLRSGGAVVVSTPNLASLSNRLRVLLGRYPKLMSPVLSEGKGDHIHVFTVDTLRKLFENTGFYLREMSASSASPRLGEGFSSPYWPLLAQLCPSLGDLLVATAQRT